MKLDNNLEKPVIGPHMLTDLIYWLCQTQIRSLTRKHHPLEYINIVTSVT